MVFEIRPQRPHDAVLLDPLLDRTFGTDRLEKTVYRLRAGIADLAGLAFAAVDEAGGLQASIRYWPVLIEAAPAILLGPLAVEPALQGRGMGRALVRHSLTEARRLSHRICLVVGEADYYAPYGFTNATAAGLLLPGPVDPNRFLVLELKPGALIGLRGLIARVPALGAGASKSGILA